MFHRDPGIGDGWVCPLPNGYAIGMIDFTDRGYVYKETQDINSRNALVNVCLLQIAGHYMAGGVNYRTDVNHGPGITTPYSPVFFSIYRRESALTFMNMTPSLLREPK
jgi:hypothetical protein